MCCCYPRGDIRLNVPGYNSSKMPPVKTLPARVASVEYLHDTAILKLDMPKKPPFVFLAGQYIDILLKDGHTRSYSLAGSPAQAEQLELHIRKRDGGLFSGMLFGNDPLIKEKTIMRVRGPMGTFTLNEEETQPIILLATGTGFAPIQSILLRLIEQQSQRQVHLYWGGRNEAELYYAEQAAELTGRLKNGELPPEIAADLPAILHMPDKQSLTYKAFAKAADSLKLSFYELAKQTGGIQSLPQYLLDGFKLRHFPRECAAPPVPDTADLPHAEGIAAFSIDDDSTTEVDDALSVQNLPDGGRRIGIHIAAPALAVQADDAMEKIIFQRQSTAYFPGGKITMLPDEWVAAFSLDEGKTQPAVSIYFDVDAEWRVGKPECKIERVAIADNLRIQTIEPHFNRETGLEGGNAFPHHDDLAWFYRLAVELQKQRGKYEPDRPPQYDYGIELLSDGQVQISRRERGSPIDTLVSEMMILANSTWAEMLHDNGLPALFRVQPALGKVRMSTKSEPHIGMGVQHYGWFTSPLRRAADYVNQKQLISLIDPAAEARFKNGDPGLFAEVGNFESAYTAYQDFQRDLESYWSLVWLEQQNVVETQAQILKEDLVRIDGLPLVVRATGIPPELPPRTTVKLKIAEIDSEKRFIALSYLNAVV